LGIASSHDAASDWTIWREPAAFVANTPVGRTGTVSGVKSKKLVLLGAIALIIFVGVLLRPRATKPAPTAIPPDAPAAPAPNPPAAPPKPDELDEFAKDLSAPGHTFFDPEFKIMGKYPEGWSMKTTARWGASETTLAFSDPDFPAAAPSVYYRVFTTPLQLAGAQIDEWLRQQSAETASQRVAGGLNDYVNGEMIPRKIGDRPALTWTASYTRNGEPWGEYLTQIYSPNGTTLFSLHAPAKDLPALIPKFERIINATIVP
jgi:hypothetical protein